MILANKILSNSKKSVILPVYNQFVLNMELPDFMSYSDKFSAKGFVEKISRIAKRAGSKLVYAALVLYYTLQSKEVSYKDKAMIIGALGYLISPLDVLPDAIPIVGLSDDLTVLLFVINKIWMEVPDEVKNKAMDKLSDWFDEDELEEVEKFIDEKLITQEEKDSGEKEEKDSGEKEEK